METSLNFFDEVNLAFKFAQFKLQEQRQTVRETVVVKTKYGPIKGIKRITGFNVSYFSFEGIPYAKPPLGKLRFRAPVSPEPWLDIKDCTTSSQPPLQPNIILTKYKGCEDCLYLNVYTKNINPSKPVAVMVWIYGGGFTIGEATREIYSPDYLMQENIVLITINYRIGPFGFLSLNDPKLGVPGNAGLKDQVMALKWIKANCVQFGGDPENITIFGQSAGGASVHFLMLTEQTKGLFHKAICMSGSALCPWANTPGRSWAYRLAKAVGFKGSNIDADVFQFLVKANGKSLINASQRLATDEEKLNRYLFLFGPVVEPYSMADCIIPIEPRLMMKTTWSNDIPLLIGGCSFEGLLFYPEMYRRKNILSDIGNCEFFVPLDCSQQKTIEQCKVLGEKLKNMHFTNTGSETLSELLDLFSIREFWHPMYRTIQARLEYSNCNTFVYRFDYDSKDCNLFRNLFCGKAFNGTCHGDEVGYVFKNFASLKKMFNPETTEHKISKIFIDLLTNFAENGDPNDCGLFHSANWYIEPAKKDPNELKCLNISEEIRVINLPEMEKLNAWNQFYPKNLLY